MSTGRVVAICGKGGVGKTTVCALLAGLSAGRGGRRTLAVDADPAGGLTMALGLDDARGRRTVEGIRLRLAEQVRARTVSRRTAPVELDSLLLEALVERGSLALLTAGRPTEPGCYCALNTLLREAIARLSRELDLTLIDAEAGVEQVNREVLGAVDLLLLVVDGSARSLRVAETIAEVADGLGAARERAVLLNRARDAGDVERLRSRTALPVLGAVPEDDSIRRLDAEGRSLLELLSRAFAESPARAALRGILPLVCRGAHEAHSA
jgi:CO dehydrogenase maturation factor